MIAIIKYNAGNTRSVQNAVNRLGYDCKVTDDLDEIRLAEKIILPGVGEASSAMQYFKERGLDKLIVSLKQPFLGICLGLQIMCNHSEENDTNCLGIFNVDVKKFPPLNLVPHMGWNNLQNIGGELFKNITTSENLYFVHSYFAEIGPQSIATCDYILPFSAAMKKDNFYATQFHPEKSANAGADILKNFLEL